jgi:hypothetical protein
MNDFLVKTLIKTVFFALLLFLGGLIIYGIKNINQIIYPLKNFKKKKKYLFEQNKIEENDTTKIVVERPKKNYGKWNVYKIKNGKKQFHPIYSISDSELNKIDFD